jgi:signal transduction histidine kinase
VTSLRARVLLGAVLWTIGLLAVSVIFISFNRSALGRVRVIHLYGHATAAVAIACMIAGLIVVRAAIRPLDAIRQRLVDVRKGRERRLQGAYPSEVQPLVDDLNALLAHNEQIVTRANARAGDLAHGLKTPLAVLANEAGGLAETGDAELAATIAQQVALMQRQVDYHLAHARAAAAGAMPHARSSIAESADGLRRALLRLHAPRGLRIDVTVDPAEVFHGRREDLDEMLGNLLDNACKWARSRVGVSSTRTADRVTIVVEDDGDGLDASMRERVLQRGVRADEAAPGSGLGLAIVRDIAELYGGSIALHASPLGGLRAELTLRSGG